MESTALKPNSGRLKLDELPAEILIRIFSFAIGTFAPRLQPGDSGHGWKVLRLPSISYFLISKSLYSVAQRARLESFSGTIEHCVPTVHPHHLDSDQTYVRLRSRLIEYLGVRIKWHKCRMGSSRWIPSLMQGVDTKYPMVVDFTIRAIFDPFFWHCVAHVPVPKILSGGVDDRLEMWLAADTYRSIEYHNMAGFVEYPWSQVPKNVEVYLTAHCVCRIPQTKEKYSLDIVFVWKDVWRRHEIRFKPDQSLSPEDMERLVVDSCGLYPP